MPINISLYPANWKTITLEVKEAAIAYSRFAIAKRCRIAEGNHQCQCCGKRCYKPGERPQGLIPQEWTADILQVHHRNHNIQDNRLSNLMSVCASCHLNLHRGRYSPVSEGQLKLF